MELTDDGLTLLWLSARDFLVERVRTRRYQEDWTGVEIYWAVSAKERRHEINRLMDEVSEDDHAVLRCGGWLHLHREGVLKEAKQRQEQN